MKRLLLVTDQLSVGGIRTYVSSLIQATKNSKQQIAVLHWHDDYSENLSVPHSQRVEHCYSGKGKFIKNIFYQNRAFWSFYKKFQPDTVILNQIRSATLSLPSLLFIKLMYPEKKIFFQFHGSLYLEQKHELENSQVLSFFQKCKLFFILSLEKFFYRWCDQVVVFSEYARQTVAKISHQPQSVVIIHPGNSLKLRETMTKVQARKKLGLSLSTKLVLTVSRLEPRKGYKKYLEIIEKVSANDPDIQFIFCSIFHQQNEYANDFFFLQSQSRQLPLIYHFHSPSFDQKQLLYSAADLVFMPSVDLETFGFSTLEALSMGVPVALFDIGANKELVQSEKNGYIQTIKGDQLAIDIVSHFRKKKAMIEKMKSFALKTAAVFSWKEYAKQLSKQ